LKKKILVIVGPTASGKSALAVRLAKKFNGEIISADSRQVYKGLNIGTGKITRKDMRGVPHYLLDIADPQKQFSASDYKKLAEEKVRYIVQKGKLPIVVGGTGFYIDVLTGAVSLPDVPPNKFLRKKLEKESAERLFIMLLKKNRERALAIGPHNKVRLIRALEIIEKIGRIPPLGSPTSKYSFIFIGLKPDNLDERIRERLIMRLPSIIREANKLNKRKVLSYKRMHELGLEYRYVAMYLQNKLNKLDMFNKLNTEIRRYAKRQMTWFKRNKGIVWFKPERYQDIEKNIKSKL